MPSGVDDRPSPIDLKESPSKNGSLETTDGKNKKDERKVEESNRHQQVQHLDDEGVEVVLGDEHGGDKVVEAPVRPRQTPDQNVFRHPHPVRPRAMRAPHGPPAPQPYLHASGSWGYPPHAHHYDYPPPPPPPPQSHSRPYPVPPYNPSGSFDDGPYHHQTPHYSPHIQYPPPRYPGEDVNVISPNHKTDPHSPHYRPPLTPRPRHLPPPQHYYQYPPTSPVSRPGELPSRHHGPPRMRNYAMRRGDGPYSKAQRGDHRVEEGAGWNPYPPPSNQPPLVAESSFDSEHHTRDARPHGSHPATPGGPPLPPPPPPSHDPHYQFYGGGGSWGSFDSGPAPPPHFDDHRYYGFPPDSPYSTYPPAPQGYSPGGIYPAESFPPPASGYGHPPPQPSSFSYSYDDEERLLKDYDPDRDRQDSAKEVTPASRNKSRSKSGTPVSSNTSNSNMLLPKAAEEVDFEVTDPPLTPVTPPSDDPICESLADVNSYDVLCGRGGGTNSQVGNRRFRKLVQEFQPTYLLARRKEKPLLARTIVLIIRKRGGRFLKKNEETGELFEVGDAKAEAKTSQALREGLDVRATKSAASSLLEKKKKKLQEERGKDDDDDDSEIASPKSQASSQKSGKAEEKKASPRPLESPPTLPRLQGDDAKAGSVHPHSPDNMQYRKRRRIPGCGNDRFFPDFCPPRADIGRPNSPLLEDDGITEMSTTPIHRNNRDDDIRYDTESIPARGCAGIALDMVTGAATGSFCLGPTGWRR